MKGDRKRVGNEKEQERMKSEEENVEVSKRYSGGKDAWMEEMKGLKK